MALKILLEQGVLGAVTVLSIGCAVYMYREQKHRTEQLLAKAEAMTEKYNAAVMKMSETINALTRYNDYDEEE